MSYAALIRPVIDRIHVSLRRAARAGVRELYASRGLAPGHERLVLLASLRALNDGLTAP